MEDDICFCSFCLKEEDPYNMKPLTASYLGSQTAIVYMCADCYMRKEEASSPRWSKVATPDYYRGKDGVTVSQVIESFNLGFSLGNVIKYTIRAEHKGNKIVDLEKAMWYIHQEIIKERDRLTKAIEEEE